MTSHLLNSSIKLSTIKGTTIVEGNFIRKPNDKYRQCHLVYTPFNLSIAYGRNLTVPTTVHFNNLLPRYFTRQQTSFESVSPLAPVQGIGTLHCIRWSNHRDLSRSKADKTNIRQIIYRQSSASNFIFRIQKQSKYSFN